MCLMTAFSALDMKVGEQGTTAKFERGAMGEATVIIVAQAH